MLGAQEKREPISIPVFPEQQIMDMANDEAFAEQGISALVQHVC
jgi:hypothetical protein